MDKLWWHLACLTLASFSVAAVDTVNNNYRLPTTVLPFHYDLRLLIDIDPTSNFTFYGIVHILVKCETETDKIVLHGKKFTINNDNVKVTGADNSYEVKNVTMEKDLDLLTIQLDRSLTENMNYTIVIPFYGNLVEELDGVYVSSYPNKTSEQKEWLVTTQFEAISARKGFPCFDEPAMKATFTVTLGHDKDYTAVSNMPLVKTTKTDTAEDSWLWDEMMKYKSKNAKEETTVWDHFETSVPMSTYLLAFVISKFAYAESPDSLSKTKFRIWARSNAISQTEYASNIGPSVLTYYEKYFGIPFPLPKQDMFAIPDFSAGAMENWGLITYRETALLYDPKESSLTAKQRVAEVIAHELAHQWFGNLVTMKWWSDLWLNEGFATYVASVGVHAVEPKWRQMDAEAVSNARTVFALDGLNSSHPVSVELDDPNRISEIFDAISYSKGSGIIRMMVLFLGENVFREGIKNYLMEYSYKNAEQDDLWRCLTEAAEKAGALPANLNVKQIMDTWTKQTGYPVVTVSRKNYEDDSVFVTQRRYLTIGALPTSMESWYIPLNILTESQAVSSKSPTSTWLMEDQGKEEYKLKTTVPKDEWILLNADMIGLYRVNYDARNWEKLISTLDSSSYSSIPELSRVQLLADSLELAWGNQLNYDVALKLVKYLQRETELLPMETGLSALSRIDTVLSRTVDYGALQKFMRKLITKSYQNAGGLYTKKIIDPEDVNKVKMQTLTSRWACRMKVPNCEENAIEMFSDWMKVANPDVENPIPVDLRNTVYCTAVGRGSVQHWAFLFQRYQNANVAAAKTSMMIALTCTKEIWILKQYLEWTVDNGPEVRSQDADSIITSIARSSVGYYIAKPFVYSRVEDMDRAFFGQSRRMGRIVKAIVEQFTTDEELEEFLEWRTKNEKYLKGAKLAVEQAIEGAKVNIEWLKRNQKSIVSLLRQFAS